MTPEHKNDILSLINAYKLSDAFAKLDKLNLQNPDYARLKKEFIAGKSDVNFVDRLLVLVNNLTIEENNTSIFKSNLTIFYKNMKKIIAHQLTMLTATIILLLSAYWFLKSDGINRIEPLCGIIGSFLTIILGIFFSYEEKQIAKKKNVVERGTFKGKNIHIGDTGQIDKKNYDEKNIVKDSNLEADGDIRIGDTK